MRSSSSLRRLLHAHPSQCTRSYHRLASQSTAAVSSSQRGGSNLQCTATTIYHKLQYTSLTHRHQPTRNFATKNVEVPTIADSVTEGTVAAINKAVGDAVEKDEVVIVLETDKVSVDIRSTVSGKIESIEVSDGDTVKVGQVVIKVAEGESGSKSDSSSSSKSDEKSEPKPGSKPQQSEPKEQKSDSKPQQQSSSSSQSQQSEHSSSDDSHGRVPLIKFTHGRANRQSSSQKSSQPQQQQQQQPQKSQQSQQQAPSSAFAETLHFDDSFSADNDKAYEAYKSLNSYYKRKRLLDQQIEQVNLGGIFDPPAPPPKDKGGKPARK